MDRRVVEGCVPMDDPLGGAPMVEDAGSRSRLAGSPLQALPAQVVQVPVPSILYLQAMAENGLGDRPKPRGHALPDGHVRYRQ